MCVFLFFLVVWSKVNDFFSFPMEIDLSRYTADALGNTGGHEIGAGAGAASRASVNDGGGDDDEEGVVVVAAAAAAGVAVGDNGHGDDDDDGDDGDDSPKLRMPAKAGRVGASDNSSSGGASGGGSGGGGSSNCLYRLKGILAHTGTSDSGHYYSFIASEEGGGEERSSSGGEMTWREYNDKQVLPFDSKNIPRECFGGIDHDSVYAAAPGQAHIRNNNAYLLVYDRVGGTADETTTTAVPPSSRPTTKEGHAEVSKEEQPPHSLNETNRRERADSLVCLDDPPPPAHSPNLSRAYHRKTFGDTSGSSACGMPKAAAATAPAASEGGGGDGGAGGRMVTSEVAAAVSGAVVPMHPSVARAVFQESTSFLNDRHLFDPAYFRFVWRLIALASSSSTLNAAQLATIAVAGGSGSKGERAGDNGDKHISDSSLLVTCGLQAGLRFSVEVLAHAKAQSCVGPWCAALSSIVNVAAAADRSEKTQGSSLWSLRALAEPQGRSWLEQMLVTCPHASTKASFQDLLLNMVVVAATSNPSPPVETGVENGAVVADTVPTVDTTAAAAAPPPRAVEDIGAEEVVEDFLEAVLGLLEGPLVESYQMTHVLSFLLKVAKHTSPGCHCISPPPSSSFSCSPPPPLRLDGGRLLLQLGALHRCVDYSRPLLSRGDPCLKSLTHLLALVVRSANTPLPTPFTPLPTSVNERGSDNSGARDGTASSSSAAAAAAAAAVVIVGKLDEASEAALLNPTWLLGVLRWCPDEASGLVQHLCWNCTRPRAYSLYKLLVEQCLGATAGQTMPTYRLYFSLLAKLLALGDHRDGVALKRANYCLPSLADRCARLAERQAPGDAAFIYDTTRLLLWVGAHVPGAAPLVEQYSQSVLQWRRLWNSGAR
jgi:hypothetical protein